MDVLVVFYVPCLSLRNETLFKSYVKHMLMTAAIDKRK